jgi:hypothetical protein
VWLVCLADTPVARAQTVAKGVPQNRAALLDDVQRRLKSGAPSEIAWGAFLAAQYRLDETIPAMTAALQRPASAQSAGHYSMIGALLDSLIQPYQYPQSALRARSIISPHHARRFVMKYADSQRPVSQGMSGLSASRVVSGLAAVKEADKDRFTASTRRGIRASAGSASRIADVRPR